MFPGNSEFRNIGSKTPKSYDIYEQLGAQKIRKKISNYTATDVLDLMKKILRCEDVRTAHKKFWDEVQSILQTPQTIHILINILNGRTEIAQFYIEATGSSACNFRQLAAWMLVEKYLRKNDIDKNELKELFLAILNDKQTKVPLKKTIIYELGVLCDTNDKDVIDALTNINITDIKFLESTEDALDDIKKTEKYKEKENHHHAVLTLYLY